MARARNIKPGFFTNDVLAEHNDPLGRLLFIGLWTLADCNGNLEWRSKRIKAQLLPYDDCDIKQLGINLDKSGFVRFYSDGDKILLHIPKFVEHQNPHKNERDKGASVTPFSEELRQLIDLKTLTINPDLSGADPESDGSDRADSLLLNPDSPSLNPEGGIPNDDAPPPGKPDGECAGKPASRSPKAKITKADLINDFGPQGGAKRFDEFWETYPRKTGKENARKAWKKIKPDDSLVNEILNAVRSQARTDQWQRDGGQYIPHPATWLNGKRWEDEIIDPEQPPPGGQFGGGLQVHFGGKS